MRPNSSRFRRHRISLIRASAGDINRSHCRPIKFTSHVVVIMKTIFDQGTQLSWRNKLARCVLTQFPIKRKHKNFATKVVRVVADLVLADLLIEKSPAVRCSLLSLLHRRPWRDVIFSYLLSSPASTTILTLLDQVLSAREQECGLYLLRAIVSLRPNYDDDHFCVEATRIVLGMFTSNDISGRVLQLIFKILERANYYNRAASITRIVDHPYAMVYIFTHISTPDDNLCLSSLLARILGEARLFGLSDTILVRWYPLIKAALISMAALPLSVMSFGAINVSIMANIPQLLARIGTAVQTREGAGRPVDYDDYCMTATRLLNFGLSHPTLLQSMLEHGFLACSHRSIGYDIWRSQNKHIVRAVVALHPAWMSYVEEIADFTIENTPPRRRVDDDNDWTSEEGESDSDEMPSLERLIPAPYFALVEESLAGRPDYSPVHLFEALSEAIVVVNLHEKWSEDPAERARRIAKLRADDQLRSASGPAEEFLRTCGVCWEDAPGARSVLTACGHLTCAACAETIARGGYLVCPYCRAATGYVLLKEEEEEIGAITAQREDDTVDEVATGKNTGSCHIPLNA